MLSRRQDTASGADAVHFSLKDGAFIVVKEVRRPSSALRATNEDTRELRGLQHEKRVYRVLSLMVELRVCPFFVRRIELKNEPATLLATSSYGLRRFMFLSSYLKRIRLRPKSDDEAAALVVDLLYALEVLWRIGVRHNDLHTKNILMVATPPSKLHGAYRRFEYLPRGARSYVTFDVPMLRYEPMIFDVDRAFKFEPSNSRVHIATGSMDTSPVTNRWWWHEPAHGVGTFDMHKVLQQLRRYAGDGTPLMRVLQSCFTVNDVGHKARGGRSVCLSLSQDRYRESTNSLDMSWINKYMIPVDRKTEREIVPSSIWDEAATPDFFIRRLLPRFKTSRARIVDTASMRPLYAQ